MVIDVDTDDLQIRPLRDVARLGIDAGEVQAGDYLGVYHLLEDAGEGAIAKVFRAISVHPAHAHRLTAVKVLNTLADARLRTLFQRECYLMAMLQHRHIVETYEAGVEGCHLYIAMEYIDGCNLSDLLAKCRTKGVRIPIEIACGLVADIAEALAYAHSLTDGERNPLGIVHRDVTPANVFISFSGVAKLGDFGVAQIADKSGAPEGPIGTLGYFSPEALQGEDIDGRSDVFALGAIFFELVTGVQAFDGDSEEAVARANERAWVPPPSTFNGTLDPGIDAVVLKAMAPRLGDRYQSAAEMLDDLQGLTVTDRTPAARWAIGKLARTMFEDRFAESVALSAAVRGQRSAERGGWVAALVAGVRSREQLTECLCDGGYSVETHETLDHLETLLRAAPQPTALVVDMEARSADMTRLLNILAAARATTPVVVMSGRLEQPLYRDAFRLGAQDFLLHPWTKTRLLLAIEAASQRFGVRTSPRSFEMRQPEERAVLILSSAVYVDRELLAHLHEGGFYPHVALFEQAEARLQEMSPLALIFHVDGHGWQGAMALARRLRASPGIETMPVVFMTSGSIPADSGSLLRAQICRTDASDVDKIIQDLLDDARYGRVFARFAVKVEMMMTYRGRAFAAGVENLGRQGVLLRCAMLPPVHALVRLSFALPTSAGEMHVCGTVAHVLNPLQASGSYRVGVTFASLDRKARMALISYIAQLAAERTQPEKV